MIFSAELKTYFKLPQCSRTFTSRSTNENAFLKQIKNRNTFRKAFRKSGNFNENIKRKLRGCPHTHREIFSKSYQINLKSDYIYHFPIDSDPKARTF